MIGERGGRLQRALSPCVVVLDHGLYHHIDDTLRRDLCALFLACINRNRREIHRLAHKCAGPLGRFFPLLLSPWFILGTSLSAADVRAAKDNKLPPSVSAKDVGDAMTSLHVMGGNVLGVLHSFGYVRGLLNGVSFGERRRLKSIARMALFGLVPPQIAHRALLHGDHTLPWSWRWKLCKARANVDITAALLHLLTTATTEEFEVSKTPAPWVHLAAACLRIGRMHVVHKVQSKLLGIFYFFYPEEDGATGHSEGASDDGDSVARSSPLFQPSAASRKQVSLSLSLARSLSLPLVLSLSLNVARSSPLTQPSAASRQQTQRQGDSSEGRLESGSRERVGAITVKHAISASRGLLDTVRSRIQTVKRRVLRQGPPPSASAGEGGGRGGWVVSSGRACSVDSQASSMASFDPEGVEATHSYSQSRTRSVSPSLTSHSKKSGMSGIESVISRWVCVWGGAMRDMLNTAESFSPLGDRIGLWGVR